MNITGWDSKKDKDEVGEGGKAIDQLVYEIDIKRPGPASFFKSIFPVACMIVVAGMTLLLKPKSAAGRLTAATGALLTIVAFHISSTGSLPPLGYLTRMDKFMVGNYFIYLVNIVRADEAKNEALATKLYNVAQIAVLGTAAVVWGLVWGAKI